jgi:hypothetical protein
MSDEEIERFKKAAEAYKNEATSSTKAARRFLIELGVFTERGNLRKRYRHLRRP